MTVNILYLIQSMGCGGTERQLMQLIGGLEGSRYRPHLVTLVPSGEFFDVLTIPKRCLQFRSFSRPSVLSTAARLSSFIRRHDIHIVQTFFQDPFLLAAMIRPFHKIRLIGSFRDLGFWRTPAETRKMRLAYPFFNGFIANAQAVKDHFVQADGLRAEKFEIIYNGIEVDSISPALSSSAARRGPVVGMVANCNRPVKRVEDFIRTAALVYRRHPDARFMVVGDGYLRPQLEALAHSLGLAESLTFTGQVAEPIATIRTFEVGVITSETEGLSNAILEYMACGVPVVATATGGNPELVREGENGYLVPVGDVELMAERIGLLLRGDALRRQISGANLTRVKAEFSLKHMVVNHQDYYERILEG
jgi:glycosyltransferase involved in cell wall biosynthesis